MGTNSFIRIFVIITVVVFGFCLMGSSCTDIVGTLPPKGKTVKTSGKEIRPPQGYIDWKNRESDKSE